MLAIAIRYLCGVARATHPADRQRAEWPPHPDRVFMALAAAHFETDGPPEERAALEWLERQEPPEVSASQPRYRDVVTAYVPVNDTEIARRGPLEKRVAKYDDCSDLKQVKEAGLALLPESRSRQARTFPAVIPDEPLVHLCWPEIQPPPETLAALADLCAKVTYVGHSSSLVQVWVEDSPPECNWVPTGGVASTRMRVPSSERLKQLESRHSASLRPTPALWQAYARRTAQTVKPGVPQPVFDRNLFVLRRVGGSQFGLESTLQLTKALRDTLMKRCPVQPPPEWISGHKPDGSPSEKPHVACIPLPNVGFEHSDGRLLGMAVVVPKEDVVPPEEMKLLGPLFDYDDQGDTVPITLIFGNRGEWVLQLEDRDSRPVALTESLWTRPARRWATVTPIVLDVHPKQRWGREDSPRVRAERQAAYWLEVEQTIAASTERIGLPRPVEVVVQSTSPFIGAPHARQMPLVQRKKGGNLHHTHAVLTFEEPVAGPVLLGAGRYRGYGLCRPLPQEEH